MFSQIITITWTNLVQLVFHYKQLQDGYHSYLNGKRWEEGEQVGWLGLRFPVQDGDSQGEKRFGEVNVPFSFVSDRHTPQTKICPL